MNYVHLATGEPFSGDVPATLNLIEQNGEGAYLHTYPSDDGEELKRWMYLRGFVPAEDLTTKAFDASQPRYPAGDERGGQWMPSGAITTSALKRINAERRAMASPTAPGTGEPAPTHPDYTDKMDDSNAIDWPSAEDLKEANWEKLPGGGYAGNEGLGFYKVTTADKREWFVKETAASTSVEEEQTTGEMLRALGLPAMYSVPSPYLPDNEAGNVHGILAPWLKTDYMSAYDLSTSSNEGVRERTAVAALERMSELDLMKGGLADYLIGNNDRHIGNLMVSKSSENPSYVMIDNGRFAQGRVNWTPFWDGRDIDKQKSLPVPPEIVDWLDDITKKDLSKFSKIRRVYVKVGAELAKRMYTPGLSLKGYRDKLSTLETYDDSVSFLANPSDYAGIPENELVQIIADISMEGWQSSPWSKKDWA